MVTVTVVCSQCWNGNTHATTSLKMSMILVTRTTWIKKKSFPFKSCLHGSSKSFLIAQDDKDSHNAMLVHFTPQEMTWNEARQHVPWQQRQARNQRRKEKQKTNKRKSFQEQEEQDQSRGQSSSAASSSTWKPRYR